MQSFDPSILSSFSHCLFEKEAKEWEYLFEFLKGKRPGQRGSHPLKYAPCCNTILIFRGRQGYQDHGENNALAMTVLFEKGEINREIFFEMLKEAGMDRGNRIVYPGVSLPHFKYNLEERYQRKEEGSKDKGKETDHLLAKPQKKLIVQQVKEVKDDLNDSIDRDKGRELCSVVDLFVSKWKAEEAKKGEHPK